MSPISFFLIHLHFSSVSQDCSKLAIRSGAVLGVVFFLFVKYLLSWLLCVRFYSKAQMAKGFGSWSACGPVLAGDDMNTVPAVLARGGVQRGTLPSSASHIPHKRLHEHQTTPKLLTEISL